MKVRIRIEKMTLKEIVNKTIIVNKQIDIMIIKLINTSITLIAIIRVTKVTEGKILIKIVIKKAITNKCKFQLLSKKLDPTIRTNMIENVRLIMNDLKIEMNDTAININMTILEFQIMIDKQNNMKDQTTVEMIGNMKHSKIEVMIEVICLKLNIHY